jgi:hypothetical protein
MISPPRGGGGGGGGLAVDLMGRASVGASMMILGSLHGGSTAPLGRGGSLPAGTTAPLPVPPRRVLVR